MYPRAWATVAGALCLALLVFATKRSEADTHHISSGAANETEITGVTPPDHAQRFHDGDTANGLPIWISCEAGDVGLSSTFVHINIPVSLNLSWNGTPSATWTGTAGNGLAGVGNTGNPVVIGSNFRITTNKTFAGSVDSFQISGVSWNCGLPCQGRLQMSVDGGSTFPHQDNGTLTIVDHPTGSMAAQTIFPSAVTQLANPITITEANRADTPDPLVNRRGIWQSSAGNFGIRLEIPAGLGVSWDTAVTTVGSSNGKVSTNVTYPGGFGNRIARFNVTADFGQNESVTISNLKFNVPPATADTVSPFSLNVLTGPAGNLTPHATVGSIDVKGLPILNSTIVGQQFTVGDPPTNAGNIVLTDAQGTPKIKIGASSVRVTIPAGLNMEWDPTAVVTVTNTAGATTALNAGNPYTGGNKTMNIDVGVANFGPGDSLTIQNARFRNFTNRTPVPTALTLALTPALPAPVSDQQTRLINRPQILSVDDQVFVLNQGNATLHNITLTDDATNPKIVIGSKVRIRIPSTPGTLPGMQFTGVPTVGPAKLNGLAVSYPDAYTAEFTSSVNFAAGETAVISGLQVNVTNPNGIGSLQLLMSTNAAATPTFTDTRVLVIGNFPTLGSVAAQQFTVNDLPTATSNPITVTAVAGSGGLFQSGKSLQLMIPDQLLCEWDTGAPGVVIGGSVAGTKVAAAVTYPLDVNLKHKIVQLAITNDWVDTDTLTFTNLRFTNFSGACFGPTTRLFLRVDVGGATAATDGFNKSIGLPTIVSTGAIQIFGQGDGPTPISQITISEDPNTPRILSGKHLRIRIPLGFPANWQRVPAPALTLGGAGAAKVSFSQYYTNPLGNDVLEFLVTGTFLTTDQLTISGPIFTGFASTTAVPFHLELEVNDSENVPNAFDLTHTLKVGTRALLTSGSTADQTGNGSIDQVSLVFTKNLNGGTSVSTGAGFTIAGYTIISGSLDALNQNIIHFLVAETGLPDTGAAPLVSYNALAAGADLSESTDSLTVNSTSTTAADAAPPVIVGFTFSDPDANGHLDTVTFTFSETLAGTKDITRWKVIDADGTTNLLASLTNADMIVGTNTITFNLANVIGTSGTPRYQYIPGLLSDAAGNLIGVQTNNHVPVANGGIPLTVAPSLVTLDGSASFDPDGQPISFAWTQDVPNSATTVTLLNASTAKPSFLATQAGTYKFFMTVTDGLDSVTVTVTVVVLNVGPTANAGPDQGVPVAPNYAVLDGSLSGDPNGPSDALTYNWKLINGPAGAAPLNNNGIVVNYATPAVGTYEIELTVTDSALNVSKDRMFLKVAPASIPTAVAGPNIVAFTNTPVTLDGRSSVSAGGALTYLWVSTNEPTDPVGPLTSTTTPTTTFTPTGPGLFTFKLIVSNGLINSIPDPVAVLVMNPSNHAPDAVASKLSPIGPPAVGDVVTLDGTSSSDPEGTPLRFAWTQVRGPAAVLSNPAVAQPTFTPVASGAYEFQLVVSDTFQTSFPARVSFNVKPTTVSALPSVTISAAPSVTNTGTPVTLTPTLTGAFLWDQWTQTAGPSVNLSSWNPSWGGLSQPSTFTPTIPGIYRFELAAWDANGNLIVTPVAVEVDPVPTANAGTDVGNATAGQTVQLDGSLSSGAPTRFIWAQIAGPPVALSDPYAASPTFVPPAAGIYVFTLKVNDGTADSATDVVIVTAAAAPAPLAGGGGKGGGCGLGPELLLILPGMWLASLLANRFPAARRRS